MAQERFVARASEIEQEQGHHAHPWNPNSELHGTRLSSLVGLSRLGVTRAVMPPGKEFFVYHSHHREEEWIYVLSGPGVAEIDGEEYEVGAGDFMGFAAPQSRGLEARIREQGKTNNRRTTVPRGQTSRLREEVVLGTVMPSLRPAGQKLHGRPARRSPGRARPRSEPVPFAARLPTRLAFSDSAIGIDWAYQSVGTA